MLILLYILRHMKQIHELTFLTLIIGNLITA